MKKPTYLVLFLLSISSLTFAQKTYVPDNNFEQALIDLGYDNVLDDSVLTANINTVTWLFLYQTNISDLTGIESFTALEKLSCSFNNLTSLDLSMNLALDSLVCNDNQITRLNISNNTALRYLTLRNNLVENLDVSNNISLNRLDCNNNRLESLNVKNGKNNILLAFNVLNNPNLLCIQVDDASWSTANWLGKDATASYSEDCSNSNIKTYVPDNNFEQALIDLGYDNVLDDSVLTANINTVTFLDVSNKNIININGIASFTALEILYCNKNQIVQLDVSNNTDLKQLYCEQNQLRYLNVSTNPVLSNLVCEQNQLTSLNISNNHSLENLNCRQNQLTSLDISATYELVNLNVSENKLTSLDASYNSNLKNLYCQLNDITTLNLPHNNELIEVDCNNNKITNLDITNNSKLLQLNCNTNQLTSLDVSGNISLVELNCTGNRLSNLNVDNDNALLSLNCSGNQLTRIDVLKNTALIYLNCSGNQLANIDVQNNTALRSFYCYQNILTILDISSNVRLELLQCHQNNLTTLDLSNNPSIEHLHCYQNQLTNLNISNNTALKQLYCHQNQLTNLDISKNSLLTNLWCYQNQLTTFDASYNPKLTLILIHTNQLTSLNVKNGNNTKIYLGGEAFNAKNNPNLACIQVDNANWSTAYWPNKDATASYSEDCSNSNAKTYVPDDNFEQALIDLGYDNAPADNYVPTATLDTITSLDLSNMNISDLSGIEAFTALKNLNCSSNSLIEIDLSALTLLEVLNCSNNQLTSLDVSNNLLLISLNCEGNHIESIKFISDNPLKATTNSTLLTINCSNNNLTNLDVSGFTVLISLVCSSNQLTNLNVFNNTALELLGCENNLLTTLDVSNMLKLNQLYCFNNQLTNLNVSNCPAVKYVYCEHNKLTFVNVNNDILLENFICSFNQLTSIDVSTNTALRLIECSNNLLLNLDLSENESLMMAHCNDNQFVSFNIKNGNNSSMWEVVTLNNPNLTCIQVDDAALAEAKWRGYTDPTASFSENCGSNTGTDADGDGVGDGDDDFPNDPTKAFANYFPATGYGSLGFEDLWPGKGDYDFNDLVLDYRFTTITNASNKVVQIVQTFIVKASGAALKNGFGFNLPDANPTLVNNLNVGGYDLRQGYVNLKSNGTESGQSKPTIIAFDNVFNLMPHPGSGVGVNTETASPFVPYDTLVITLTPNSLNYTMNDFSLETWNPFIIVNGERGKEVHLIDNPPTDLANRSYFGTWEDKSNQGTGKYYRTSNGSPWAINIAEPFVWPLERVEIPQAYLHFLEWAISSGAVYPDWYKDFSGYRDNDKLYIQR